MNIAMHCGSPDVLEWLIESEGEGPSGGDGATEYDVKEEQIYEKINEKNNPEEPRPFNLLGLEWLLQRKWKKSEEEVRRCIERVCPGHRSKQWITPLWEKGIEEKRERKPSLKKIRRE